MRGGGHTAFNRAGQAIILIMVVIFLLWMFPLSKASHDSKTLKVDGIPNHKKNTEHEMMSPSSVALPGFSLVVDVHSSIIAPDITRLIDYRTSQLAIFNKKSWPSRRVLYKSTITDGPKVVLVLPLDAYGDPRVLQIALEERKAYCALHGYGLFTRYIQDFAAEGKPARESLGLASLRMLRQAMLAFPTTTWFWLLSVEVHIKNLSNPLLIEDFDTLRLLLQKDLDTQSVSITHFTQMPEEASIIVTPEPATGMISAHSIITKRSLPSRVFLEHATDPLIQNWEPFLSTSSHAGTALTHILRWHSSLLSFTGLIPPYAGGTVSCADSTSEATVCLISTEEWMQQ